MNFKKSLLTASLLFVMGGVSAANAAAISSVATATADVTFASASKATIVMTPKTDLQAGQVSRSTPVAEGQGSITGAPSGSKIAFRWTPGSGTISGFNNQVSGKNDQSHKLALMFVAKGNTAIDNGWIVPHDVLTSMAFRLQTLADAEVAADTYPLSVDAVVWGA
ncbi:hypothetical protein MLF92_17200 [Escherichia coli]|nr:hypothetical protein [Escherichia coli]MCN2838752.1 hypothetical protein [Escherichia coli]MCN4693540.1 hypothetical protein [Escherichia coli]MCN7826938.1 hypothetical protein [Escherichia coli]